MAEHKFYETSIDSDENFEELIVKNLDKKDIFVTPFYDFELEIDNDIIKNECLDLMKAFPKGVKKSNHGGGWQSDVYELSHILKNLTLGIQNLARNAVDLSNQILEEFKIEYRLDDNSIGWWININTGYGYNVHHTHPGCNLIGLYYPSVPKNMLDGDGKLHLLRCDALCHNNMFADLPNMCEWAITPKVGHLYIMPSTIAHYVKPHFSEETRISIAFNIG
jgi:uncharacterized protein (TIGR02466 family)